MKRLRILEFVEEDNGSLSATRAAFLLWVVGVLIAWCIVSIRSSQLQAISPDIATIIGILMTGKVIQKFGEKPADEGQPPPGDDKTNGKASG